MQATSPREANPRTGKDKVEQYKWMMAGEPGQLVYLAKSVLEIDHTYQRSAKNSRVLKLTRKWNWLACGVLTVAKRGCRYYVVDGQHRLMAAMKRGDIERLPCVVFESAEMRDEAVAFRDANRERRPITTLEQWNAELVAQDDATLFAHALITNAGRTPAKTSGPSAVCCLSSVVAASRNNRDELLRVWPLAIHLCAGNAFHERVFSSLMYLEVNIVEGQSVTDKRWRDKLERIGYKGILDASQRAAAFYAKGGAKIWAQGVMQELNKGCSTRTLSMRFSNKESAA